MAALFRARPLVIDALSAERFLKQVDQVQESLTIFVLEGNKFVALPQVEYGQFYSAECYVVVVQYWRQVEGAQQPVEPQRRAIGSGDAQGSGPTDEGAAGERRRTQARRARVRPSGG